MAESVDNAGKPVVEHGPYRRLLSGDVLRYQPGRVVVLTGPGGYRVVSANEPIRLLERWLEAYTHYAIIDTTAKQAVRTYRHTHSSDPRYSFDIQVTMSAKVDDPVAFLQDFGRDASVFDAFYNELLEDVANTLSDCPIDDLVDTQQRLSDYARDIKKDQPFYKGVKIHQFNVVVKYGPELLRKLEEYDLRATYYKDGEEGLVFQGAMDPTARAHPPTRGRPSGASGSSPQEAYGALQGRHRAGARIRRGRRHGFYKGRPSGRTGPAHQLCTCTASRTQGAAGPAVF